MPKVWTCPTCATNRRMRFCPQCGEERLRPDDLSIPHLIKQFAKDTSSVDGKLVRSSRVLLTKPGELTAANIRGERRRYITPLALFFIANAIFVAAQSMTGLNVLSSPLESHLHSQDWSPLARDLVGHRLMARQLALQDYAPVFDRSVAFNAKALIILMALLFASVPAVIFRRPHRPAGAHIVFALHLYAFVLLLLSVSVLLAQIEIYLGGEGLRSPAVDKILSLLNLSVCGTYIYLALSRVYGTPGWPRLLATVLLTLVIALLFVAYRFAIFLITFYTS